MKKIIVSLCLAFISIATVSAQNMSRTGDGTKSMKQYLRKELSPETAKADSVLAVYDAYNTAFLQAMLAPDKTLDERTSNLNKAKSDKEEKLKNKLQITDDQVKKFDEYFTNLRRNKTRW